MLNSYFQGFRDDDTWDETTVKQRARDELLPLALVQWPLPVSPPA